MFKWLLHKGSGVRAAVELRCRVRARADRHRPASGVDVSAGDGIGKYRKDVPLEALFAAGITAVRSEDCGPARSSAWPWPSGRGRSESAAGRADGDAVDDAARCGTRVALHARNARHDPSADQYRDEIIKRWGPRAVVTLAFAILTARMYPTVKYTMGHGKACTRIVVGGAPLAFDKRPAVGQPRLHGSCTG